MPDQRKAYATRGIGQKIINKLHQRLEKISDESDLLNHGLKQKPEVPLMIRQVQPPPHCVVVLQLPGQKVANPAPCLSCMAETVPAESMKARMAANNILLTIF